MKTKKKTGHTTVKATKRKQSVKTSVKKPTVSSQPVTINLTSIPPYPVWFRKISLWGFILFSILLLTGLLSNALKFPKLAEIISYIGVLAGYSLFFMWLFYGLYRLFRYFTTRALVCLSILIFVGAGLTFSPPEVQEQALCLFRNNRSIIFLSLMGLILGHGVLTLFWKKACKIGWFIFFLTLFITIVIIGQVLDYVAQSDYGYDYGYGADKPIIYLYPTTETDVSVQLGNPDNLTHTYPPYGQGWHVTAQPDGNLTEKGTGRKLYALYWEGKTVGPQIIKEGFIVAGKDTISFLEEKLPLLGLNERETEEFIIYWLPQLEGNKYNLIRFLSREEQEEGMPLTINPTPDTVIRVLMAFKPLSRPVRVEDQILPETPERNGFVVVEWGGTKLGTDLIQ